ncbi:hypothetical protein TELCIR_12565, partial [Teladorsagia circumcincta]
VRPTSDSDEDQHEDFYDDLGELVRSQKSNYVVVSGDFNARLGSRRTGENFMEQTVQNNEIRLEKGWQIPARYTICITAIASSLKLRRKDGPTSSRMGSITVKWTISCATEGP